MSLRNRLTVWVLFLAIVLVPTFVAVGEKQAAETPVAAVVADAELLSAFTATPSNQTVASAESDLPVNGYLICADSCTTHKQCRQWCDEPSARCLKPSGQLYGNCVLP